MAQYFCQSWGETTSYSKNQIYIHCCTWILSLTDVYFACSSVLFLVGVTPLLHWPSLQTLKTHLGISLQWKNNNKNDTETLFTLAALWYWWLITFFKSYVHHHYFFLPVCFTTLNVMPVTVLSSISEKYSVKAVMVVADVMAWVTSILAFCNFSEHWFTLLV